MADPRFAKQSQHEGARGSRGQEDQARRNDGLESTSAAARRAEMEGFHQVALPTLPKIHGWHLCWLSTTNSYDPIHRRMRLGYEPLKYDDMPEGSGFEQYKVKSGEQEGFISVNEMVAYKIPEDVYQENMRYFHHDLPQEEQQKLAIQDEQLMGKMRDSSGRSVVISQPSADQEMADSLLTRRPAPSFG